MTKVNGQSVAAPEKSLWAGPTLFYFLFHVKHEPVACGLGLRTVVRACGRDPPLFFISFLFYSRSIVLRHFLELQH